MELGKGSVCVTGGTGFIASWLIKKLLEEGYSVHTTIRVDPDKKRDISFLTDLPGAAERLKIFHADLSVPDSFDAAIQGCKGVLHVAATMDLESKETEEVVTKREINGALGILQACLNSKTVKKFVYTSSACAVMFNNKDAEMMDESFWTDVDFVRENLDPSLHSYVISKTMTEKAVLEFAACHGFDVVTVIPTFVVGPFICPKFPDTLRSPLGLVLGTELENMDSKTSMVHIDDVARAHIFLLENPDAKGRYNCSRDTISLQNMAEILSANHPEFLIPPADSLAKTDGPTLPGLSSKKLLETGFEFNYGVEEMFDGAIQCCKEKGYI